MRIWHAGLALGAFGTLTLACDVGPDPYNVISFCIDASQAMCQVASMCSVDPSTCQTYQYKQCLTKAVQSTSPERRIYSSDNAHFCIGALQAAYHDGAPTIASTQLNVIHDVCESVYTGTSGVGQFCLMDYDCSPGLVCAPQMPGLNPVVCEPAQPAAQGQSCEAPGSQCAADTYCAKQTGGGGWTCSPCPGSGQQCGAPGSYCMSNEHCVQGTCQARGGNGAPCVGNDDCGNDSPYCDPYSNTCAPGLSFQRGSIDCRGVAGLNPTPGPPQSEGGADAGDHG
jgi:hypothetical protein